MNKKTLSPKPWLFPRPVLLVSTRNAAEHDNVLTVSWAGIATVLATREFVVNVPTAKQREAVEICGTTSGKDTDKFAAAGLSRMPAVVVAAPLIVECPINLECQVRHVLPLGSHDLFVGEVVKTHVQHAVLREDGRINDDALDYLAWGFEQFFKVLTQRKHLLVPRFQ
jgi:flavin reductase (DIM6/NTAB) family NADH-FMN oxidoreductase RutF